MNTVFDAMAMWGLLQLLFVWFLVRAGELRELERQNYVARNPRDTDWIEIESLYNSATPGHIPAATSPPGARGFSTPTSIGKAP